MYAHTHTPMNFNIMFIGKYFEMLGGVCSGKPARCLLKRSAI